MTSHLTLDQWATFYLLRFGQQQLSKPGSNHEELTFYKDMKEDLDLESTRQAYEYVCYKLNLLPLHTEKHRGQYEVYEAYETGETLDNTRK